MKQRKFILIIYGIIFLLFLKGCLIPLIHGIKERNLSVDETRAKRGLAKTDYMNLFTDEARKQTSLGDVYAYKSKNIYASFGQKNGYHYIVYKMSLKSDNSLKNLVRISKEDEKPVGSMGQGYEETGWMHFSSWSAYDSIISTIFFTYSDSILGAKAIGDSIINLNVLSNNISFRFEKDGPADMNFNALQHNLWSERNPKIEMNVTFYKKGTYVYIIVIHPYLKNLPPIDSQLRKLLKMYKPKWSDIK